MNNKLLKIKVKSKFLELTLDLISCKELENKINKIWVFKS